jgi:5-methylcytosine-specific restriction enzyme subunit McrC
MSNPPALAETAAAQTALAPTTTYGIPVRNWWYMLLYAWGETPHSPYWRTVAIEESPSLDALLAYVLTQLLQQRLRIGLGCSYVGDQRLVRGLRGRVHFTKSLKQRAFERGQAVCEFEEYTINAPKNQIIRSTLFHLTQVGKFGPDKKRGESLRHTLRRLVRTLDGIDLIELTPDFIHRQQAERHDRDYRIMLAVCDLILQKRLPTEYDGRYYLSQLEKERLVLHNVYERFVANFYRYHLQQWHVQAQKQLLWHENRANQYLPTMRPDLVLREKGNGRVVILDTKFTAQSLIKNQWGKGMFDSSHLYQIYTYLTTQEHLSEQDRQAVGILLYPAVQSELSEQVELPRHQIRIECVNLAASWPQIEQRLLAVVGDGG